MRLQLIEEIGHSRIGRLRGHIRSAAHEFGSFRRRPPEVNGDADFLARIKFEWNTAENRLQRSFE